MITYMELSRIPIVAGYLCFMWIMVLAIINGGQLTLDYNSIKEMWPELVIFGSAMPSIVIFLYGRWKNG